MTKTLTIRTNADALDVEKARDYLARAVSVPDVRDLRDKAQAVAVYLRSRNASAEAQNDAAEIKLRAERRLGELTREMPKAPGAREAGTRRGRTIGPRQADAPTLASQGIRKQDASKWQMLAKIPAKTFDAYVKTTRAKQERITSSTPLKLARLDAKTALAHELRRKPLPRAVGRFDVIAIDPPWQYAKRAEDVTHRGRNPYPDMDIDAIKALPVAARANPDCILWLWTTNAFMREALGCLDAWGFEQKTILTWVKDRMGTGDWLRGQTEHCLMAVRGKPMVTLTNQTTALHAPLREHSRKPDEFFALVDALCPGTKLEMFAREPRNGWQAWGAEPEAFAS
mgnify:CR=1 FL=1